MEFYEIVNSAQKLEINQNFKKLINHINLLIHYLFVLLMICRNVKKKINSVTNVFNFFPNNMIFFLLFLIIKHPIF